MKGINKAYGYCSRKKTRNCNAKLKLNKDGQIVAAYTDHCHPPPKYTQMPNGLFLKIDNGVEVIQLADNGPMVYMYQNYTFAMKGAHKEYGTCSRRTSRKCKAKFKLNEYGEIISAQTYHNHPPPKLVKTSNGRKVLLYQGYTFSQHGVSPRNRYCSKKLSMKCPASLVIDAEGNVVVFKKGHNHPPPRILRVKSGMYVTCGDTYEIIKFRNSEVILYKGYTFHKSGSNAKTRYCSKRAQQCRAKIILDDDETIVDQVSEHNHTPPSLYKSSNGSYCKV
ncbi:hypothetical protein HF086_014283 [Spodoptera exigua]|uniref:FLYWCH-type domain-containing protein n=1 Tax=Spodoptera exigua TaxID=7107 RepID=A0A922M736_SPOEX|nr:hypothetical protein HF086_014283 [Spodoptera exigua]